MSDDRQLDLFDLWAGAQRRTIIGSAEIVAFPLFRRSDKVRDVATKLAATKTDRHADHYREQVTSALRVHLRSRHVPAASWATEIARFWQAVELERLRQAQSGNRPTGAA